MCECVCMCVCVRKWRCPLSALAPGCPGHILVATSPLALSFSFIRFPPRGKLSPLPLSLLSPSLLQELETMFARFGVLSSLLLPASKSVALVDFVEPSEARAAFKGLAYRR